MRFLVDAQLPPALARMLASRGHVAEHVVDIALREANDSEIWQYALANHAIVVTKDEDFAHRLRQGGEAPVILWLRVGNTSRQSLLKWFEPLLPQIESWLESGERLVEVR
jgi:predicted nuclease of predicted toxin-antitoxin system